MAQTIEQQIAAAEAHLERLRNKSRALENGQKIILGGLLLNAARSEQNIREWLLKEAEKSVTREADKKRLAPLLDELKAVSPKPSPPTPLPN